MTLTTLSVG